MPRTSRSRRPLVALSALALLGTAACGGGEGDADSGRSSVTFGHVHGLGVDDRGRVLVASHEGLVVVPGKGQATRRGETRDLMGFAVSTDELLASGHPGPDSGGPAAVGLVASTDGGRTWTDRSLSGEVDFHALDTAGDRVYGFDSASSSLLVSDDGGGSWEIRGSTPVAALAVDPRDPEQLVATTERGPARSTDAGRSFELEPGAPPLFYVDWAEDGSRVGLTGEGDIYVSTPEGEWTKSGSVPGMVESVLAVSGQEIYVVSGGVLRRSADGGRSFEVWYASG